MANLYIGVSSKARLVKNIYIGVNGKARKVQKAYIGVGGKARLFYSASTPFAFTYTGSYATEGNLEGNFVIRFKTSGTLTIGDLGNTASKIDVFMVGGGASGGVGYAMGSSNGMGGHGGGSGYTKTVRSLSIAKGNTFKIIIGAGGESAAYNTDNDASDYTPGNNGGMTSFGSYSVNGGTAANAKNLTMANTTASNGGSSGAPSVTGSTLSQRIFTMYGGSDGGLSYSNPSEGSDAPYTGTLGKKYFGTSQGTTTREFGESTGKLYAGGGGAAMHLRDTFPGNGGGGQGLQVYEGHKDTGGLIRDVTGGTINTGSGGGGGGYFRSNPENQLIRRNSGAGGSGIVCIRNAR